MQIVFSNELCVREELPIRCRKILNNIPIKPALMKNYLTIYANLFVNDYKQFLLTL